MSVIQATRQKEIRRITVPGNPGKKLVRACLNKTNQYGGMCLLFHLFRSFAGGLQSEDKGLRLVMNEQQKLI
jgi:hypothetical protein